MSEETTSTPTDNGGQPGLQPTQPATPATPPTTQSSAAQPVEPYRAFATEADLTAFITKSKKQAERAALRKLATDLGFEDADDLRDAVSGLRRADTTQAAANQPTTPEQGSQQPTAAERLTLALTVAETKGLPVTLVQRLQGNTKEEMEADADRLLALLGGAVSLSRNGVPSTPTGNQPVTFTRAQLQDADFVRKNVAAIQQAAREGRIVNS